MTKQNLSWAVALLGVGLFLAQAGEIVIAHETWSDVFAPEGFGHLMRIGGSVLVGVLGMLGIRMATSKNGDNPPPSSGGGFPPAAVVLIGALTIGAAAPACALRSTAPATMNPSVEQVQATRELAVKIAGGVEIAAGIAEQALGVADSLEQSGILPASALETIARAGKAFGEGADAALVDLEAVAAEPSLVQTVRVLVDHLDPLLAALEGSGQSVLVQLAASMRIATTVARAVL